MRWSPTRVPDWNWNWTAVRPERYIFLNILVTVRNRLVTQPCHLPATTHYVPTTLPGYVAGHSRAVPAYVSPSNPFLCIYTYDFLTTSSSSSFVHPPPGGASSFPRACRRKPLPLPSAFSQKLDFFDFLWIITKFLNRSSRREREREGERLDR